MSQTPHPTLPRRLLLAGIGLVLGAVAAQAGSLDAPAEPSSSGSALYTLEDIYNRLTTNTQASKRAGGFTEPSAGPAPTGHTLVDVYTKAIPTQVPKTGQTTSYAPDDDGDLEKGVTLPNPRFTFNNNGTVTDNLTGLIWLKDADCIDTVGGVNKGSGYLSWSDALTWSNALAHGKCSLSDGSTAGDWRLPNTKELQSLVDFGEHAPALPSGSMFVNVQSKYYWSSTSLADPLGYAWDLDLNLGLVSYDFKSSAHYVWPVRGGQ